MNLRAALGLARPFTLLAPMVGTGAGAWVAHGAGAGTFDWRHVAPALASAVLATTASNAWNQAFDEPLDAVNKPGRPLPSGRATRRQALWLGHIAAALALAAGALASMGFLACVGVGVLATWIYSAPPLRTKRHLLGALFTIAIPRGALVPVAGWATIAPIHDPEPWWLGLVTGLFVLGAAATKDFADIEGDRAHGCRTLPIVVGPKRAARRIAPFLFLPFLLYPLFGALGLLHAPQLNLCVLGGILVAGGLLTAYALVRDPAGLAEGAGNHPAWIGMYLLMTFAHAGTAVAYVL